jgi:hypothetical protein
VRPPVNLDRPDDLDTIRCRLAEPYYGTRYSDAGIYTPATLNDDLERYATALNRAMEDLFKCVNYIDQIQEVNSVEDVMLLKGEVPYARVAQTLVAKLFTGAGAATGWLRKKDEWRLAVMASKDPEHDINVQRITRELEECESAMRLAHGFAVLK